MHGLQPKAMGRAVPEAPATGGATPGKREAAEVVGLRRLSVSLAELKNRSGSKEEPGAQERTFPLGLLACGSAMVMEPDQERLQQLRERVLGERAEVFRRSLTGEPPAKVTHMRVKSKPESKAPKAWPCVYPPRKRQWLFQQMEKIEEGMIPSKPQAMYASVAMPKGIYFQLMAEYMAVSPLAEAVPWPHPNLEQTSECFQRASCFASLDRLHGLWQVPMDEEGDEAFTMGTQEVLFSPRRVPQGVLNATPFI